MVKYMDFFIPLEGLSRVINPLYLALFGLGAEVLSR